MEGEACSSRARAPGSERKRQRLIELRRGGLSTKEILERINGEVAVETESEASDSDDNDIYEINQEYHVRRWRKMLRTPL